MATLKLKVVKSKRMNPSTKQMGFAARVITNGKVDLDDIAKEGGRNTTMHKAEVKLALELCMEAAAEKLKEGNIVDLGPVGKLYPSCSSGWVEKEEDLQLADVKPSLYYKAADEVSGAVKSAKLQWSKPLEDDTVAPEGGSASSPSGGENNEENNTSGGGGFQGNPDDDTQGGGSGGDTTTTSVATPVISDDANITANGTVHVTCATDGAQMYYTVGMDSDPADPTNQSTAVPANGTIVANESYSEDAHLKGIAYKDGVYSSVASKTIPARQDD